MKNQNHFKKIALFAAFSLSIAMSSFFLVSCLIIEDEPYFKDNYNQSTVEKNLSLWKKNAPQNYEFTYKIEAETAFSRALGPNHFWIKTVVKDGVSTVTYVQNDNGRDDLMGQEVSKDEDYYFSCVEDMFKYIQDYHEVYKTLDEHFKSIDFDMKFNSTYGYPEKYEISIWFRKEYPSGTIIDRFSDPGFSVIEFKEF